MFGRQIAVVPSSDVQDPVRQREHLVRVVVHAEIAKVGVKRAAILLQQTNRGWLLAEAFAFSGWQKQ